MKHLHSKKEYREFIKMLAERYVERRSDVSEICHAFLKGEDLSIYTPEHRHVEGQIGPYEVDYDTLTTLIEYRDLDGEWKIADDIKYTD